MNLKIETKNLVPTPMESIIRAILIGMVCIAGILGSIQASALESFPLPSNYTLELPGSVGLSRQTLATDGSEH